MNSISNVKNLICSIRSRPTSRAEKTIIKGSNVLQNKRAGLSPQIGDPEPILYISNVEAFRKRDLASRDGSLPTKVQPEHPNSQKFNNSYYIPNNSRKNSRKNRDLNKYLEGQNSKMNSVSNKNQRKSQFNSSNNSQLSTNGGSDIDSQYKRQETFYSKEETQSVSDNSKIQFTNKTENAAEEVIIIRERKQTPEFKIKPQISPISIEKREAMRAFALKEEYLNNNKEKSEVKAAKESYKTLTSAYNSNNNSEELIDYYSQETEHDEEIIKEIVEKHVDEAHRNIGLIKENFRRKSKTYLFYQIYQES